MAIDDQVDLAQAKAAANAARLAGLASATSYSAARNVENPLPQPPVSGSKSPTYAGDMQYAPASGGGSNTSTGGGAPAADATVTGFTPNADGTYTWTYSDGKKVTTPNDVNPSTGVSLGSGKGVTTLQSDAANAARIDALQLLKDTFSTYGLESLIPTIQGFMTGNVGPNEATLLLKQTPEYQARFAGNTARVAAGLNALTEAEYLGLENQYSNLMNAYGVKSLANKTQFASLIGNDVSQSELNQRLDLAVNQVQNADPTVLSTLKQFYPNIGTSDLVSYFLAPAETLPALQRQVQTADIGAAAINQGLTTSQTSAAALAAYGVTQDQAKAGYAKVAAALPATSKLANIYGETGIKYDQTAAESEFLKDNASVARQRQQLAQLENANFSGRSGLSPNVDALKQSLQGKF